MSSGTRARGERPGEHPGDLTQQRVAELVPRTVVDLLQVVAIDHDHAHRLAPRPGRCELALEPFLQAPAVEHAGEGIRDRALALTPEHDGRVQRGRDVRREDGSGVELHGIHAPCRRSAPDQRSDLLPVGPQRKPDERSPVRVRLEQLADDRRLHSCSCAIEQVCGKSVRAPILSAPCRQLHRQPGVVPHEDLTRLEREHLRQRRSGERGDLPGVADAADVREQPCERGQVEHPLGQMDLCQRREHGGELLHDLDGVFGQHETASSDTMPGTAAT
jgi:hypothetical protein